MVNAGVVAAQGWSNFEEISHFQGLRRCPSKMVGGVNLCLKSNPIPTRNAQRAQTNLARTRTQRQTELHLSICVGVQVSSRLPQGQGLWVQQTWVWHKPSWRRLPLIPPWSCQNLHRTGERDSWRAQTEPLVHTRTQEKGAVTPQKTDLDLPVSVQESPVEAWVGGGLLQGWGQ